MKLLLLASWPTFRIRLDIGLIVARTLQVDSIRGIPLIIFTLVQAVWTRAYRAAVGVRSSVLPQPHSNIDFTCRYANSLVTFAAAVASVAAVASGAGDAAIFLCY